MDPAQIREVLHQFRAGILPEAEAERLLSRPAPSVAEVGGYARVDLRRKDRCGFPEVVFGLGKTPEQIVGIVRAMSAHGQGSLVTRVSSEAALALLEAFPHGEHNALGRTFRLAPDADPGPKLGRVAIVTAGTSDLPVAEEAHATVRAWNCEVQLLADVGVAGLHRLLSRLDDLTGVDCLVVAAGMEGALPSVVGGLVDCPVIAVPTSVGYGASFGGLAAMLGMLNSCASNVVVVNIDSGFNAGHVAGLIARRAGLARQGLTDDGKK